MGRVYLLTAAVLLPVLVFAMGDAPPSGEPIPVRIDIPDSSRPPSGEDLRISEETLTEPSGRYFNQLPQPQFLFEKVGDSDFHMLLNGGVGRGWHGAFFCEGADEANAYRFSRGRTSFSTPNELGGTANKGKYDVLKLTDRCRTEGCGAIPPDDKVFLLGIPLTKTNCHTIGRAREGTWSGSEPESISFDGWEGRNYHSDFTFGRYLLKQTDTSGINANELQILMAEGFEPDPHFPTAFPPYFFDIPYTPQHQSWGFTCPFYSRAGVYERAGAAVQNLVVPEAEARFMEVERAVHYRDLLNAAKDEIQRVIANGELYGNVYVRGGMFKESQPLTPEEEAMADILNAISTVLEEEIPKLCNTGMGCFVRSDPIRMRCCATAPGTHVEFNPEEGDLCLDPAFCGDCQSKRSGRSHAHYNVSECTPSYGGFSASRGAYEPMLHDRRWYVENDRLYSDLEYPASKGYSPVIAAQIAHQLVHSYYSRIAENHSSLEATWEERIAVIMQAMVLTHLCRLDYCPEHFSKKTELYWGGSFNNPEELRRHYWEEPRGYGGIFLGPLFLNSFNIERLLQMREAETAQMMAHFISQAPLLDVSEESFIHGEEWEMRTLGIIGDATPSEPPEPREELEHDILGAWNKTGLTEGSRPASDCEAREAPVADRVVISSRLEEPNRYSSAGLMFGSATEWEGEWPVFHLPIRSDHRILFETDERNPEHRFEFHLDSGLFGGCGYIYVKETEDDSR